MPHADKLAEIYPCKTWQGSDIKKITRSKKTCQLKNQQRPPACTHRSLTPSLQPLPQWHWYPGGHMAAREHMGLPGQFTQPSVPRHAGLWLGTSCAAARACPTQVPSPWPTPGQAGYYPESAPLLRQRWGTGPWPYLCLSTVCHSFMQRDQPAPES